MESNNLPDAAFGPYRQDNGSVPLLNVNIYRISPDRTGNPELTYEKRKEFSIGLDAVMINNKLTFEVSYFNNLRDGQIVTLSNSMPYMAGIGNALPYFNFNNTRYFGLEIGSSLQ